MKEKGSNLRAKSWKLIRDRTNLDNGYLPNLLKSYTNSINGGSIINTKPEGD